MKINLNNKYSDIGDLPVYKELTVKEMILSESYFPNGMKMYKKLYYALMKFLFLYVKKVKNKIQKIIQLLYNNKNRAINKTNTIGNEQLKISLIIPVFSYSDAQQLRKTYQSVISQEGITEGNIMIIANECHNITDLETIKFVNSDELVLEILNSYFLKEDCDIVSVLPCGDVLHPNALVYFKNIITTDQDLVYCNETILDGDDYYKPNYSPDTLRSYNYIGDFIFCNKTLFEKIGGMNTHASSSYSYYFNLKATHLANKVHHINKVLLTLAPEREFDTELNKQQLISILDSSLKV